jgi:hypothetical protein
VQYPTNVDPASQKYLKDKQPAATKKYRLCQYQHEDASARTILTGYPLTFPSYVKIMTERLIDATPTERQNGMMVL